MTRDSANRAILLLVLLVAMSVVTWMYTLTNARDRRLFVDIDDYITDNRTKCCNDPRKYKDRHDRTMDRNPFVAQTAQSYSFSFCDPYTQHILF